MRLDESRISLQRDISTYCNRRRIVHDFQHRVYKRNVQERSVSFLKALVFEMDYVMSQNIKEIHSVVIHYGTLIFC